MPAETIRYHRQFGLSADNLLVEQEPGAAPAMGSVARELEELQLRQHALNARLTAIDAGRELSAAPTQAGVYPLKVTSFTCRCEGHDEDGAAELLIRRLGNLQVITEVPFMRKGNIVFAIRAQGLVDADTGRVECVDALFGGGIYWHGTLNGNRFDYELLMFRSGKDRFVGRMSESIDLSKKVGDIDPEMFQAEVAYHLHHESNDSRGNPTLARGLADYANEERLTQVAACYGASARFATAVETGRDDLHHLAENARSACVMVPGKRYYQAYEAFLQGFSYDPTRAS